MPTIEIEGGLRAEVDESWSQLSPEQQQATANEIFASVRGGQSKDTSRVGAVWNDLVNQFPAKIAGGLQVLAREYGVPGEELLKKWKETNEKEAQAYGRPEGGPQSIAEGWRQNGVSGAAEGMLYGVTENMMSSLPGLVQSFVPHPAVKAIAAAPNALMIINDVAEEKAKKGLDAKFTDTDWASVAAQLGIDFVPGGSVARAGAGVTAAIKQEAKGIAKEAGQEATQEGINMAGVASQGAEYNTQEVTDRLVEAGGVGGATRGVFGAGERGIRSTSDAINALRTGEQRTPVEQEAAARLAARIQQEATDIGADLTDVDRESASGAEVVLSNAHTHLAEEIKGLVSVLKPRVDPMLASTLEDYVERLGLRASFRDALNKVKNTVSDRDFSRLEAYVGGTREGQKLLSLMRQSNELTGVFRRGVRGGVSQYTDELAPLGKHSRYLPAGADNSLFRLMATGAGLATNPLITAAQLTGFGAGRLIDAATGKRSRVADFVKSNLDPEQASDLRSDLPSLYEERVADEEAAKQRAENARESDVRNHLERILTNNEGAPAPAGGTASFTRNIYDQTGMKPTEWIASLQELMRQGQITEREAAQMLADPKALMEGNRGNRIIDLMYKMNQRTGGSEAPTAAQPSPNVPPVSPFAASAYSATAQGNQARYNRVKSDIDTSSFDEMTRAVMGKAAEDVAKANNKADAEAAIAEGLQRVKGEAEKAFLLQKLTPLVASKRHATPEAAAAAGARNRGEALSVPVISRDGRGRPLARERLVRGGADKLLKAMMAKRIGSTSNYQRAPNLDAQARVRAYKAQHNINKPNFAGRSELPTDFITKLADWFDGAKHDPKNPDVVKAYTALTKEVKDQYKFLGDLKIEPWSGEGEPYRNSGEMLDDLTENKHLFFFLTDNGFGMGDAPTDHPMLAPTEFTTVDGRTLLVNDLFRIVHDYFGHAPNGFQFGPVGEYNAFHEHASMFSDEAVPALAAETLAQNAWVNFGSHVRGKDIPASERPFAEQKATVVPQELLNEDPVVKNRQKETLPIETEGRAGLRFDDKHITDEVRKKTKRKDGVGAPKNERVVIRPSKGSKLPPFVVGNIKFTDWVKRTEALLSPEEITQYAKWYDDAFGVFLKYTNGDRSLASKYMVGFLVANQNTSVESAMQNVLLQAEQYARGIPLDTMRKGGLPGATSAARAALMGQLATEGVGIKIADFIDSGVGNTSRSWFGHNEIGGKPFVVDVHTARDTGLVDPILLNHLERLGYKVDRDNIKIDFGGGGVKGTMYESRADWGRKLTDHLNKIAWQGRTDWEPKQVQAVGWMALNHLYGGKAPSTNSALESNFRRISFEAAPGEGSPAAEKYGERFAALPFDVQTTITQRLTEKAIDAVRRFSGVDVRSLVHGSGGWMMEQNPASVAHTLSSKEGAAFAANALGYVLQQTEVWANAIKGETKNPKAFAVDFLEEGSSELTSNEGLMSFWKTIVDADANHYIKGYQPIVSSDGRHGIRALVTQGGAKTKEALTSLLSKGGSIQAALDAAPFKVSSSMYEADVMKARNNWKENPDGELYLQRLSEFHRGGTSADWHRIRSQLEEDLGKLIGEAEGK